MHCRNEEFSRRGYFVSWTFRIRDLSFDRRSSGSFRRGVFRRGVVSNARAMTGRRGPGVQHHLRGNRTTTRGRSSQKRNRRRTVLYVGNLGTEEGVKEFVSRRAEKLGEKAPKVFNVKIFEPKSETRSARLTVAEGDAALLRSPNFWPRPIYARLWNFDFVSKPSLRKEDSESEKEGHEPVDTENDNSASGPSTSSQ